MLLSVSAALSLPFAFMSRGPRLDAAGALHHVMARGIEKRPIFFDDEDREDLVRRLGKLAQANSVEIAAWALMPNHFHLLVRTGDLSVGRFMQRLLTGYAATFNHRHERVGHLFQNRFRSTLCEDETYFLELLRYIHLNPVRGGIVDSVGELDHYPYTGHSAVVGRVRRPWQAVDAVLRRFSSSRSAAQLAYRDFVSAGAACHARPDLVGGGLLQSSAGWAPVAELRRGRERFRFDERILGASAFVSRVIGELPVPSRQTALKWRREVEQLAARVCAVLGSDGSDAFPRIGVSAAREGLAYLWVFRLRKPGIRLASAIGVHASTISRAAERGRQRAKFWNAALPPNGDEGCNYVP